MSAHFILYRIEFFTRSGSIDVKAAEKAYEWCKEKYDWFNGVSIVRRI